jgi:hypothetical protein
MDSFPQIGFTPSFSHKNPIPLVPNNQNQYTPMNILKSILKILAGMVVLILIISFFLPSQIHVERTGLVKNNPETVFKLVNNLPDWEKWSPWHHIDPNMKIQYGEVKEGKGAYYSWTSDHKNVGNGKMTISDVKPTDYIKTEMDFMENGKGTAEFFLRPVEGGTEVKWTMDTDVGMNPIGRIFGLFMDKMIGPDYEKGLHNLDSVAQMVKPEEFTIQLEMGTAPAQKLLLIKATAKEAEIGNKLGEIYGRITGLIGENGLQMAGAPLAIYETPQDGIFTFEAGIPVDKKPGKPLPKDVIYKETSEMEAAVCHFAGPTKKPGLPIRRWKT